MKLPDFPNPCLCIGGLPSRTYTDSTCLAALLLIVDNQRKFEQQIGAQSPRPIDTFFSEPLLEVMEERFIHHHHNPKLAQVLVQIEVKTFIVLPSPGAVFANVFFSGVKEEAKVAQLINIYSDWLVVLPSAQESPNAIVVHADQVAADPVIIAKALSRFGLIGGCITEQEVRKLFEQAITMTPYISEAKYGKGYDPFGAIREPSELDGIGEKFLLRHKGGAELIQSYMDISKDIGLI